MPRSGKNVLVERHLSVRRAGGGEAAPYFFAKLLFPEGVSPGHGVVGATPEWGLVAPLYAR
jgi:hypothetical protein